MRDSKLLSICEQFRVCLDVVGALKADVQAKLSLSLSQLVDVIKGAGLLAAPPETIIVSCRQAGHKAKGGICHFDLRLVCLIVSLIMQ